MNNVSLAAMALACLAAACAFIGILLSRNDLLVLSICASFSLGAIYRLFYVEIITYITMSGLMIRRCIVPTRNVIFIDREARIFLIVYYGFCLISLLVHPPDIKDSVQQVSLLCGALFIYLLPQLGAGHCADVTKIPRYFGIGTVLLIVQFIIALRSGHFGSVFGSYLAIHYDIALNTTGILPIRSNYIAGLLLAFFPLNYALHRVDRTGAWRLLGLINLLVSTSAILISGSLGASITLAIIAPIAFIFSVRGNSRKLNTRLLIRASTAVICLVVFTVPFISRIAPDVEDRVGYHLLAISAGRDLRLRIWDSALHIFTSDPVCGAGFVRSKCILNDEVGPRVMEPGSDESDAEIMTAHNFLLQSLMDVGIIGTLALLLLYLYHIYAAFSTNGDAQVLFLSRCIGLSLVAMFIHSNVETILEGRLGIYLLWFLMGLTMEIRSTRARRSKPSSRRTHGKQSEKVLGAVSA